MEQPAVAQIHGMKLQWNIYMVLNYMVWKQNNVIKLIC